MDRHTSPGLYWPVKHSFVRYVLRMADGQVIGSPDVTVVDAGTFVFAAADGEPAAGSTRLLAFRGEIRLQAHEGALAVRIANPRVELEAIASGERSRLLIDDPEGTSRAVPLVTFVATAEQDDSGLQRWAGTDVRLTVEAVPLFGGYYGEDEAFDDLVMLTDAR